MSKVEAVFLWIIQAWVIYEALVLVQCEHIEGAYITTYGYVLPAWEYYVTVALCIVAVLLEAIYIRIVEVKDL